MEITVYPLGTNDPSITKDVSMLLDKIQVQGSKVGLALNPDDNIESIKKYFKNHVVVSHTFFDRVALACAGEKYSLSLNWPIWLDTTKVVRRAWPEKFAARGYALANVADVFGIEFSHHVAKEDAQAAGQILIKAIEETGLSLEEWLERVKEPIFTPSSIARQGNPDGPLAGEVTVFTGALSIPRREAADLAAQAGCEIAPSVNKRTTLLIVGDQDIRRIAGHEKSSKHRKAENLVSKGQPIRILGESDFRRLVQCT